MQSAKKVPLRKCVGCQSMFPKRELLRVLLTPDNRLCIDVTGKQNGRGAYLCPNPDCLKVARKRKSLERALKVAIPDALYDELEERLKGALPN
jgi:uncharacterized protein